jgi:hypothetical protein
VRAKANHARMSTMELARRGRCSVTLARPRWALLLQGSSSIPPYPRRQTLTRLHETCVPA